MQERLCERLLVRRILSGDRGAGERFVAEHYARVHRMLRHLTDSEHEAEDLTQQTFLKAWQALALFRGESSLSTWLHQIAYHEYTHWLRDRRPHRSLEEALHITDDQAAREMDGVFLRRALAQLSAELRDTFILYHVQGLSVPEVAAVLGIPAGTVKSRLFTARERLRDLLSESEEVVNDGLPVAQSECKAR